MSLILNKKIQNKIYTINGIQVMLDSDLAELYGVETKALNQAVKRNLARFPLDFMFRLCEKEMMILRSQFVTSKPEHGGRRYLPYVFTEQGIATLSGVLKSKRAVGVNIEIMRAFVLMRHFIRQNGAWIFRLNKLEEKQIINDQNFKKIFNVLEREEVFKKQGIFFEGQVYDAYKFISDLIKSAEKSIILIDNYVDDTVLTLFSKKKTTVEAKIFTKKIDDRLKLDIKKFNMQYGKLEAIIFNKAHDRFLILDNEILYHFGASLKDLGKKCFAFSKFNKESVKILSQLKL